MAHYAFINEKNIVVQVIRGKDEGGSTNWEEYYAKIKGMRCVRTSYNGTIRKNYAGIGYYYDEKRDAFIPPKPHPSWKLNEKTCLWEPPKPKPTEIGYEWDEKTQNWSKEQFVSDWRKNTSLTRKQFKIGEATYKINNTTLKEQIEATLETLPEPQKTIAKITYKESTEFERQDQFIQQIIRTRQISEEEMDNFFRYCLEEKWNDK